MVLSVVIDEVNLIAVAVLETKSDPPVRSNCHGPVSLTITFEAM
jgi:hypothetical protein